MWSIKLSAILLQQYRNDVATYDKKEREREREQTILYQYNIDVVKLSQILTKIAIRKYEERKKVGIEEDIYIQISLSSIARSDILVISSQ